MKIRILLAALALTFALPATADFEPITDAYEVQLTDLRLPQSDSGTIGYKPCENCEYRTTRLSANTQWLLNNEAVTLEQFRASMAAVQDRKNTIVTVIRRLETDLVEEVVVVIH